MGWKDELIADISDDNNDIVKIQHESLDKIFGEDDPKTQIAISVAFTKSFKNIHIYPSYKDALEMINLYEYHPEDTEVFVYEITKDDRTLIYHKGFSDDSYYRPKHISTEPWNKLYIGYNNFWKSSCIYKHSYINDCN